MSDEIKNEPYVKAVELDNFSLSLMHCIEQIRKAIQADFEKWKSKR